METSRTAVRAIPNVNSDGRRPSVGLPQYRHEGHPTLRQRQRNDLLPMPAPVHVRLCSKELPAHVLEVLDVEAAESRGYLETAPRTRVRGDRAVLLIGPARGDHRGIIRQLFQLNRLV
jgi:hypothetical protein